MNALEYISKGLSKTRKQINSSIKGDISDTIGTNPFEIPANKELIEKTFKGFETLINKTTEGYDLKVLVVNRATSIWTPTTSLKDGDDFEELINQVNKWVMYFCSEEYISNYENGAAEFMKPIEEEAAKRTINNIISNGLQKHFEENPQNIEDIKSKLSTIELGYLKSKGFEL